MQSSSPPARAKPGPKGLRYGTGSGYSPYRAKLVGLVPDTSLTLPSQRGIHSWRRPAREQSRAHGRRMRGQVFDFCFSRPHKPYLALPNA